MMIRSSSTGSNLSALGNVARWWGERGQDWCYRLFGLLDCMNPFALTTRLLFGDSVRCFVCNHGELVMIAAPMWNASPAGLNAGFRLG